MIFWENSNYEWVFDTKYFVMIHFLSQAIDADKSDLLHGTRFTITYICIQADNDGFISIFECRSGLYVR
jgi:hypothetical protein